MKKRFFYVLAALFVVAAIIMISCQKDEIMTNIGEGLDLKAGSIVSPQASCEEVCIDLSLETPVYFPQTYNEIVMWGGKDNDKFSKTIDVKVYNTETDFVLEVMSTNGWSDLVIDGVSSWIDDPVDPDVWGTYTVPLPVGWEPCDEISFELQVAGNGPQGVFSISYDLIGICKDECVESFLYETDDNLHVVFTYVSEVDLTSAVVKFTCPQIDDYISNDTKVYSPNPGQMNGSDNVLTWTGNIFACEPITFDLTFVPHCTYNENSDRWNTPNVWTDFKVNDVSKKGELPIITFEGCSQYGN